MRTAVLEPVVSVRIEDADRSGEVINSKSRGFRAQFIQRITPSVYRMRIVLFRGKPVNFEMVADYREAINASA